MDTIIAFRLNGRGPVRMVMDLDGTDVAVFSDYDIAVDYAEANPMFSSGKADYQIIVLDDLPGRSDSRDNPYYPKRGLGR